MFEFQVNKAATVGSLSKALKPQLCKNVSLPIAGNVNGD